MRKTSPTATARRSQPVALQATPCQQLRESADGSSSPLESGGTTLLLDRSDLARELRTSLKTINRMISSGRLPAPVSIGKRRRWPRTTIIEWVGMGCPSAADFARLTKA
ncbi:MAG: helix-turn-helix domain-containing protein [Planctomycetaceae bacterium]|nr:helix-turn-helix domain-containing protein [Planctomycetaceae bacterium]